MLTTPREAFDGAGVPLAELVSVRQRFLRSVNLEQDFYTANPLDDYLLTPSGFAAIEHIAEDTFREMR